MSDYKTRTNLVHGGTRRSQYNEVSEAIFLTQGFVYDSAEQAEARFLKAGDDEFIYARYGNPTVAMFEERIAMLEGAEDAFATASGMAAVNGALISQLKAGDHVVAARAMASCHITQTRDATSVSRTYDPGEQCMRARLGDATSASRTYDPGEQCMRARVGDATSASSTYDLGEQYVGSSGGEIWGM